MNREDVTIKIVIINKNSSYKKNIKTTTWTLEEEAQIKYYKYNSPTKKRMTWNDAVYLGIVHKWKRNIKKFH